MEFLFAAILFFFGFINEDQFNVHNENATDADRAAAHDQMNNVQSVKQGEGNFYIQLDNQIVVIDEQTC